MISRVHTDDRVVRETVHFSRRLLVAEGLDGGLEGGELLGDLGVLEDLQLGPVDLLLALVEGLALDLPLGLQSLDDVLVFPSDLMSESAKAAEPPAVLEPEDLEGGGDDHPLLLVVGRGHSLEGLQTLQSGLPALGLVGDHPANTSVEDLAGGAEMEGASSGQDVAPLLQEVEVLEFVPVEVTGNVDGLRPHNHDLVSVEDELGDNAGQSAEHVAAAINYNCLRRKSRHSLVEVNQAVIS